MTGQRSCNIGRMIRTLFLGMLFILLQPPLSAPTLTSFGVHCFVHPTTTFSWSTGRSSTVPATTNLMQARLPPQRRLRASLYDDNVDNLPTDRNTSFVSTCSRPPTWIRCTASTMTTMITSLLLFTAVLLLPIDSALASSYGSLSTEQKVVAEAWRLVDNSFLDRSFNHQDWFAIRQKYVVQQKYKNMEEAQSAIADMVQTLGDKYTRYLTPSQYQSLVDSATGVLSNGGVGIEITKDSQTNQIYASDIQENSPAAKAGIQINDVFVQVDGQPITESNTPDDVALLLRGPIQSKVGVVMQNRASPKNVDYILQRQPIKITAVQSYLATMNNNKVGVVRIKNFSSTTASVVQAALQELQKRGVSAYLIDLRGNPGGLLPGGVDTASLLLPDNVPVVFVVNKSGVADTQSTLVPGFDTTTPVTILVDRSTASAAEVFTAALQDNHRALVVGEQTFGKGIVQTIRELSDKNGGIAITVARYETPAHHDINQQGIAVDMVTPVDCPKNDAMMCLKNAPARNPIFQAPPTGK